MTADVRVPYSVRHERRRALARNGQGAATPAEQLEVGLFHERRWGFDSYGLLQFGSTTEFRQAPVQPNRQTAFQGRSPARR